MCFFSFFLFEQVRMKSNSLFGRRKKSVLSARSAVKLFSSSPIATAMPSPRTSRCDKEPLPTHFRSKSIIHLCLFAFPTDEKFVDFMLLGQNFLEIASSVSCFLIYVIIKLLEKLQKLNIFHKDFMYTKIVFVIFTSSVRLSG